MTLHRALRVVLVLAGVGLMGSGLLWGFHPTPLMDLTGIEAVDAMSRNMLKSDMGGGLIGTSVLFIMAGIRGGIWTRATLVLVSSYLLVRSVSAVVDGPTPLALVGITVEADPTVAVGSASSSGGGSSAGAIVGGIIGGLAVLALLAGGYALHVKRARLKMRKSIHAAAAPEEAPPVTKKTSKTPGVVSTPT